MHRDPKGIARDREGSEGFEKLKKDDEKHRSVNINGRFNRGGIVQGRLNFRFAERKVINFNITKRGTSWDRQKEE